MIQFLKVQEAAKVLQVSPTKVRAWIEAGRLTALNVGQPGKRPQWRIHPDDLRDIRPATPVRKSRQFYHPDIQL